MLPPAPEPQGPEAETLPGHIPDEPAMPVVSGDEFIAENDT